MKLEVYNSEKHYEILSSWWTDYGWQPLHPSMLPKNAFVAYDDEQPIAAAFMYLTDSKVAFMDWYVGNPNISKKLRGEGLDLVISTLQKIAKVKGYNLIYSISKTKSLNSRLVDHGFQNTGEVSEMIYTIG